MSKYIKLEIAFERLNQLYHSYEVEEWLKSLPTIEVSEDCISRQAATTIPVPLPTEHRACPLNIDDAYEMGWFDCQDAINNLPSVVPSAEQSSMVGEWESSIPLETEMAQVFRKVFGVDDDVPVVIKYPDEGSEEE